MSADGLQQLLDTARAERDRARRELATLADLVLATATVYTDQALLEAAKAKADAAGDDALRMAILGLA